MNEPNPFHHFGRGQRVRELNLHRRHSVPIVLKWVHDSTAQETINRIQGAVDRHNERYRSTPYQLLRPKGYSISRHLIAMEKADYPSIEEVLEGNTPRGLSMKSLLAKKGVSLAKLEQAGLMIHERTGIRADNMLVIGGRRAHPVFLPLMDIY